MPEEELVSEFDDGELKFYIKGLLHWVCTTPIPAYSRGGNNIFDQSPSNNHRCIIWSTVEGYIGKYLLSLRRDEKFKNIEDFIGLEWDDNVIDSIPWWKDFKIAYKKKFSTMVSELGSDFFFDYKIPSRYIGTMVIYWLNHLVMMERSLNFMMYYPVLMEIVWSFE